MPEPITFQATVSKVQTLVDGGIRVTLDLPETAIMAAAQLMECQRAGGVLLKVVVKVDQQKDSGKTREVIG